jgi:hypothetical protein
MTNAARARRKSHESDETTITKLAKQTHTDAEVVRHLYEEEIAALHREAAVKGFVGVIAARRVKRRLLAPGSPAAPSHRSAKSPLGS